MKAVLPIGAAVALMIIIFSFNIEAAGNSRLVKETVYSADGE